MLDVSDSACVNCAQRRRQTRSARQTQADGRARQSRTVQRGRRTSSFRRTRAAGRRRDERARQGDGRARSGVADCASQPWRGGGDPGGGPPPKRGRAGSMVSTRSCSLFRTASAPSGPTAAHGADGQAMDRRGGADGCARCGRWTRAQRGCRCLNAALSSTSPAPPPRHARVWRSVKTRGIFFDVFDKSILTSSRYVME